MECYICVFVCKLFVSRMSFINEHTHYHYYFICDQVCFRLRRSYQQPPLIKILVDRMLHLRQTSVKIPMFGQNPLRTVRRKDAFGLERKKNIAKKGGITVRGKLTTLVTKPVEWALVVFRAHNTCYKACRTGPCNAVCV